jgi:hypothetical protein
MISLDVPISHTYTPQTYLEYVETLHPAQRIPRIEDDQEAKVRIHMLLCSYRVKRPSGEPVAVLPTTKGKATSTNPADITLLTMFGDAASVKRLQRRRSQ